VTFASLTRTDNGTIYFRGPTTGTGAIGGTPGAGPVNYKITGQATLTGLGTTAARIIPWAANTTSTTGTDPQNLITYDANGFRPLAATEFAAVTTTLTAGVNNNLQGTANNPGTITVNSIFNSTGTPQLTGTASRSTFREQPSSVGATASQSVRQVLQRIIA
jgi:hypothetical protein